MKKRFTISCLLVFCSCWLGGPLFAGSTPDGYDVTFKMNGLEEGDTCLIANYLGTKQYIVDTLFAGKNGLVEFKGEKDLDGGVYLFVMPENKYFEFMMVEPSFSMEADATDPVNTMKVKDSKENTAFYAYLQQVQEMQKERRELQVKLESGKLTKDEEKATRERARELDLKAGELRTGFIKDNPELYVAKLFQAGIEPDVPSFADAGLNDTLISRKRLEYYREHYWDNVDLSDDRLLRTPIIEARLRDLMKKYTVQDPDSLIKTAKMTMDLVEKGANKEVFRYFVITLTNMYSKDKRMCFDKVYVFMSGEYYVSGKAYWTDSTQNVKIKDRYYRMKYNTCGSRAPNMVVPDVNGKMRQLYEVDAEYTILYFWAYDCGHCKKVTPKVKDFYEDYKDLGVKVFAVSTKKETQKWKDAIEEKGIQNFINVEDPDHNSNFRVFYDIYSTPVIYVLDKEKKIVAKRLDVLSLRKFLNHMMDVDIAIPEGLEPDPQQKAPENPN